MGDYIECKEEGVGWVTIMSVRRRGWVGDYNECKEGGVGWVTN